MLKVSICSPALGNHSALVPPGLCAPPGLDRWATKDYALDPALQSIPFPFKLVKSPSGSSNEDSTQYTSEGELSAEVAESCLGKLDDNSPACTQSQPTFKYDSILTVLGLNRMSAADMKQAFASSQKWTTLPDASQAREVAELGYGLSGCATVVIKNIPQECTQLELLDMLNSYGLSGKFDFLHKPVAPRRSSYFFAFVNFLSVDIATEFYQRCHGRFFFPGATSPLVILPANVQGLHHNVLQFLAKANFKRAAPIEEPLVLAVPGYLARQCSQFTNLNDWA